MSQTFKNPIKREHLFEFLERVCEKKEKYYIFNLTSYKRGELDSITNNFLEQIRQYYHKAKTFYIDRKRSYSGICTVIRQICKLHSIMFTTKITYSKSKYNIPYYIYF
jgi:D-tyrosyl-tRNA(Tyr) deacylase